MVGLKWLWRKDEFYGTEHDESPGRATLIEHHALPMQGDGHEDR